MSYRYLADLSWADTAFEVTTPDLEQLFRESAEALLLVMIEDLEQLASREERRVQLEGSIEEVLHGFLEKVVFFKDADQLLLKPGQMKMSSDAAGSHLKLEATLLGEKIDSSRHALGTDVKAITMHQFQVMRTEKGWSATVVLDV